VKFEPNLLVTDDDTAFRQAVCEWLQRRGFRVTEACDGEQAMALIETTEIHMALLDVHMPRLSGLDVISRLQTDPRSLPCVLMSAQLDEATRRRAIEMKAYEVLDKPIPLRRLNDTVRAVLADVYGWRSE